EPVLDQHRRGVIAAAEPLALDLLPRFGVDADRDTLLGQPVKMALVQHRRTDVGAARLRPQDVTASDVVLPAHARGGAASVPAADRVGDAILRDQAGAGPGVDPCRGVPLQLAVGRVDAPDLVHHHYQQLVYPVLVLDDRRRAVAARDALRRLVPDHL